MPDFFGASYLNAPVIRRFRVIKASYYRRAQAPNMTIQQGVLSGIVLPARRKLTQRGGHEALRIEEWHQSQF